MLRNKYRPKSFKTFIGNEVNIKAIKKNISDGVQVFLLHGPRGCGKTTVARIIAKEIGTHKLQIYEFNASNKTGVDDARKIEEVARIKPSEGDKKVYIIDEIQRMSPSAQDSLLKLFEEPPEHLMIVCCTTHPDKIAKAFRSRMQEYNLSPLSRDEISILLKRICKKEKLDIDSKIIKLISKNCDGIPREAINLLQSTKDLTSKEASYIIKTHSEEDNATIKELCLSLVKGEPWKIIRDLVKSEEITKDPEYSRRSIFGYIGGIADNSSGNKMKLLHFIQGSFEDDICDSGLSGLKRQIREAYLIAKNII